MKQWEDFDGCQGFKEAETLVYVGEVNLPVANKGHWEQKSIALLRLKEGLSVDVVETRWILSITFAKHVDELVLKHEHASWLQVLSSGYTIFNIKMVDIVLINQDGLFARVIDVAIKNFTHF